MNTPSPGTDGAVCAECSGRGKVELYNIGSVWTCGACSGTGFAPNAAPDSGAYSSLPKCEVCSGTGRAKADCAPVAAKCPECKGARQLPQGTNWVPCDVCEGTGTERPSPSKRDATEVRRFTGVYGFHFYPVVGAMPFDVVDASDHTATIQASLAREAALEAERDELKRDVFRYKSIAGAGLNGTLEAEEIAAKFPNPYDAFNEAYVRHRLRVDATLDASMATLRSRLAAVEEERDKYRRLYDAEHELHKQNVYGYQDDLKTANAQLALQAEKVGRMREAIVRALADINDECSILAVEGLEAALKEQL